MSTEYPDQPISFEAGRKLAGAYTLKRELTSDTTGAQWLAESEELKREVMLWILPEVVSRDDKALTDLRKELRRNRQVIHPNIVRTHDLLEEDDWAALVLDSVPGHTLAELLAKHPDQRFDVTEIKSWITPLCQTLDDAHQSGLLHRDIAPDTIFITRGGDVRVAPFGISRVVIEALQRAGIKPPNHGNLTYLSPQILNGERPIPADDTYAFGALLFHLLTSKPPFHGDDLITQIRKNTPPTAGTLRNELKPGGEPVPAHWEKIIAQCLAKNRDDRPVTIGEVGRKLTVETPPTSIPSIKQPERGAAPAPAPAAKTQGKLPEARASVGAVESREKHTPISQQRRGTESIFSQNRIFGDEYLPTQKRRGSAKGRLALAASLLIAISLFWVFWPRKTHHAPVTAEPPRATAPETPETAETPPAKEPDASPAPSPTPLESPETSPASLPDPLANDPLSISPATHLVSPPETSTHSGD